MGVRRFVSGLIYGLSGAIGLLAFFYPFFVPATTGVLGGPARTQDAPLLTAALVGLCVIALIVELQGQAMSAKMVAMLGVLVAITSVLRFIEVAVPMPGGFSPVFAPVMLAGYVFGSRFGFLMGAFTLLVSGLITGAVGPWLPYQMFSAGWAGLTAGWISGAMGHLGRLVGHSGQRRSLRLDVAVLCVFGFAWGLLYGAILNVWFWPFAMGPAEQSYAQGLSLGEALARYATFYLVTSLTWDLARAVGNVALILLLGAPVVGALARFRRRFHFEVRAGDV
jgi:energy-coupling factor transport system substrate-specific component